MSTNEQMKIIAMLGEIKGGQEVSNKWQAMNFRLLFALNFLGMTGGTITVGTQALEGWPAIERLLGLL